MIKNLYSTFICLLFFLQCTTTEVTPPDYCNLLQQDQTHVNYDESDPDYLKDKSIRYSIFQSNFKEIIDYVDAKGFPLIDLKMANRDSCMYKAITSTFIHIAQSDIRTFYKPRIKKLLKKEIKNNRQLKSLLAKSILVMLNTKIICSSEKVELMKFITDLKLENEEFQNEVLGQKMRQIETVSCG